jgi:hypothetical protein
MAQRVSVERFQYGSLASVLRYKSRHYIMFFYTMRKAYHKYRLFGSAALASRTEHYIPAWVLLDALAGCLGHPRSISILLDDRNLRGVLSNFTLVITPDMKN